MRDLKGRVAVVIADNDAGDLENAVTELSTLGEVLGVPTDVADHRHLAGPVSRL
ncbi:hypothetical protein [Nocardia sp. X0981]